MKAQLLFILLLITVSLSAQNSKDPFFILEDIDIQGNSQTQNHVILKELSFSQGDTIFTKDLAYLKKFNEKRLLSTALFTGALINISDWNFETNKATVDVYVREGWYWFPAPILETGDRNFNVWLLEGNKDLKRINYGLSIQNLNLTGNGDYAKLKLQRGYNHKYELHYRYPYLGKKIGIQGQIFYATNDEIAYKTQGNKLIFGSNSTNNTMLTRRRAAIGITYRASIKKRHSLDLFYRDHTINPYVIENLTSNYFLKNESNMKWFSLKYKWEYDNRVFNFYPESGWYSSIEVIKDGFGVFKNFNMLTINAEIQKFFKHSETWSSGVRFAAGAKFYEDEIPYIHNRILGYKDKSIRGYELYVVDGARWFLSKYTLRRKLWSKEINLDNIMLIKKLKKLPLSIYSRINIETGYVYDTDHAFGNPINDGILYGYGPGVDFILYHTFMISVEYNFNRDMESGLYLKSSFNF